MRSRVIGQSNEGNNLAVEGLRGLGDDTRTFYRTGWLRRRGVYSVQCSHTVWARRLPGVNLNIGPCKASSDGARGR